MEFESNCGNPHARVDARRSQLEYRRRIFDQVHMGQRFSPFSQRTTPELNGEVSRVSADVSEDQKIRRPLLHRSYCGAGA
jgi:hypothetical protein